MWRGRKHETQYSVYAGRVRPDFDPLMFKPAVTLGEAIGLMEAMIKWFGKRENFLIEDLKETRILRSL